MEFQWTNAVALKREEDGTVEAYAAAMPDAMACGADEAEALAEMAEMAHALAAAVRTRIVFGLDLEAPPPAGDAAHRIALPPALAAAATVYAPRKRSGQTKVALAQALDVNEKEARRVLDPDYSIGLDRLVAAAQAYGYRLTVGASPL